MSLSASGRKGLVGKTDHRSRHGPRALAIFASFVLALSNCSAKQGRVHSRETPSAKPNASAPPVAGDRAARPNILVILTDDQRVGTLGIMPATRRVFGRNGTTFTDAFVTTPLCCPSRSSILTGRYAHNTGVHRNADALRLNQETTIERYLHGEGYQTGIVGKFLNSWPLDRNPPHFDRWAVFNNGYFDTQWNVQGHMETVSEYATDFVSDEAVRFLRGFERHDRAPWFLYVATSAPHDPWIPKPQHSHDQVPPFVKNPGIQESDLSDKPPWVRNAPRLREARIATNRADQLRTLRSVDDLVGRVFRTLHGLGENRNTLAVFLSDNGFMWGEHGLSGERGKERESGLTRVTGKRYPYTQSVEVPFLMRWPGHVASDVTDSRLVANVDLAPTFVDAARLPEPALPMDGRSLLRPGARQRLLLEYFFDPFIPVLPTWHSIRTRDLQYMEYSGRDGRILFREYYDLRKDPFQLNNLLHDGNPTDDPNVVGLASEIRKGARCIGRSGADACP